MDESASEVGLIERLRQAVRASKLSQHELARQSGVSQAQLSRFLSGERLISLPAFEKLCAQLRLRLVQEPEPETTEAPAGAETAPPTELREEQPQKPRAKRKRDKG